VEQELPTLPEHLRSPPVFSGVCVTRSFVLYVCFVDHCFSFCTFSFGHCNVLSVLRYTDSDYPFGIFKLFLFTNGDCVSKSVTECPSMEINIRHLKVALATILTKQIYVLEIKVNISH
jgi:hypothetical protein